MRSQILLGLGNNVDYEITFDASIFSGLLEQYKIKPHELDTQTKVDSDRSLLVSIVSFIDKGAGGECFVSSNKIIEDFSENFEKKITMGGTSIRAAIAMDKIGVRSTLHIVNNNKYVREQIPKSCDFMTSESKDTIYPHLIVQFSEKTKIKTTYLNINPTRSNRIIYDNDPDNIEMKLSGDLLKNVEKCKLFLISGFNAMQSEALLQERLLELEKILNTTHGSRCIYYEDACFHNKDLIKYVHHKLLKHIDIYSMNEDELMGYIERRLDLLSGSDVADALHEISRVIPVAVIIIHTQYWALAYGGNAEKYKDLIEGGVAMAGTRYQFGDNFTPEQFVDSANTLRQTEGINFTKELKKRLGDKICCVPSLAISVEDPTTIGLGDAFVGGAISQLIKLL